MRSKRVEAHHRAASTLFLRLLSMNGHLWYHQERQWRIRHAVRISLKTLREVLNLAERFEYIKCYWQYIDEETPVILFYEVDLDNERYATRLTEVFVNKQVVPFLEAGYDFVTEAPVPLIEEINQEDEFFAERISPAEFEAVYNACVYDGEVYFTAADLKQSARQEG